MEQEPGRRRVCPRPVGDGRLLFERAAPSAALPPDVLLSLRAASTNEECILSALPRSTQLEPGCSVNQPGCSVTLPAASATWWRRSTGVYGRLGGGNDPDPQLSPVSFTVPLSSARAVRVPPRLTAFEALRKPDAILVEGCQFNPC